MSTATLTRTPARPAAPSVPAWRAVTLAARMPWARTGAGTDMHAYAVDTPGSVVGEVWSTRDGAWMAYRTGWGTTGTAYADRDAALCAAGFLPTVPADQVADMLTGHMDGTRLAALCAAGVLSYTHRDGVRVVLCDGTAATVYAASRIARPQDENPAPGVWRAPYVHLVELSLYVDGPPVALYRPRGLARTLATVRRTRVLDATGWVRPAYRITVPRGVALALAPPCPECNAAAGRMCPPSCAVDQV